ncbi:MAG: replicative DNA helicase [Planctomycetota bacterium]
MSQQIGTREVDARVPPHSLEAEMSVLGAMMLSHDAAGDVVQVVHADDFYRKAHRIVFEMLVDLYDRGDAVDILILKEELTRRAQLEAIGGIEYLIEIHESVPSAANAEHYAKIVREKAVLRALTEAAIDIERRAFSGEEIASELLDAAESSIFRIADRKSGNQASSIGETLEAVFRAIDARQEGQLRGVPTGFYDFDDKTCGFSPTQLIILAARPSMGKTSFALNIALNAGLRHQKGVAIFSLEMSKEQIGQNLLCAAAEINAHDLRTGKLQDDQYSKLTDAADQLSQTPIFIDDTAALGILELRAKARRLKRQHDIQMIIIDYLQLMEGSPGAKRAENRQQEISVISRGLKQLARELDVPVVALSQLNRSVDSREDRRPRMSDLRESGSIEQDADIVVFLYREAYYKPKENNLRDVEIIIAKQRNGPVGKVDLLFFNEFMKFRNPVRADEL